MFRNDKGEISFQNTVSSRMLPLFFAAFHGIFIDDSLSFQLVSNTEIDKYYSARIIAYGVYKPRLLESNDHKNNVNSFISSVRFFFFTFSIVS